MIAESLKSMFLSAHMEPGVKALSQLLASVTQLGTTFYLLIDGLDECEDSARREVVTCLAGILHDSKGRIKVIIASRWMNISKPLKDFRQISLEASRNSTDIELYIRQMIDESIENETITIKDPSMAEEIQQALISKSDGM